MLATDPVIDERTHRRRWLTLATLCLSLLIIVMDNTILNVAIPSLIKELGATNTQLQWIIDGYVLVFAGLLLTAGSLGDRFGRKRALRAGIVLFALGSVASALSGSPEHLIVARAFMGIGGALIMPSTLSILTNVFRDPKERGRAIAIWAGCSGLGVALGPVVGGLLLTHFEWSSVFWVNLPIGATALIAGYFFVPESRDPSASRIDIPGALLSIVGLGALLFGIIEGPSRGWTNPTVVVGFIVGVVGITAFLVWERHTPTPMLDLSIFKNPRFSAANGVITLSFFALFGVMFLMTQYWQLVHGYTPLQAGIRILPHALTMAITAPLSARLVERIGTKRVVMLGLGLMASGMFVMSFIQADSSYPRVILNFMMLSAGMGLTMAPATESVMGSLPRAKAGIGAAMNDTTRQVGGALGVAVIGSIVTSVYASRIDSLAGPFSLAGDVAANSRASLGAALQDAPGLGDRAGEFALAVKDGFVHALTTGFRISAVLILVAGVIAYRFLPARATEPAAAPEEVPDGAVAVAR